MAGTSSGSGSAPGPDSVAVAVVNWNNWRLSLECLASLRSSVGVDWHLYLVDNASTDGSRDHLVALGEDVTVIASPVNGGWTGGNNLAVRRALADGYPYVFILNNDALVEPDTIATLLHAFRAHGSNPVLGPVHFDHDGETLEFIGADIDARSGLAHIRTARDVALDALPAHYPTAFAKGAGIFTARVHYDRLGLFDDAFYLNYDDTDWCFRARAAGFDVLMLAGARIVHGGSGSIGGALSPLNIYFLARNELLFAERHSSLRQRPRQLFDFLQQGNRIPSHPSRLRRFLLLLFGRTATVRAWRAGVRDYLLRRFGDCPADIRAMSGMR